MKVCLGRGWTPGEPAGTNRRWPGSKQLRGVWRALSFSITPVTPHSRGPRLARAPAHQHRHRSPSQGVGNTRTDRHHPSLTCQTRPNSPRSPRHGCTHPVPLLRADHRRAGRGDSLVTQPSLAGDVPSPLSQSHSGCRAARGAFWQVPGAPALPSLLPQGHDAAGVLQHPAHPPHLGTGARRSVLAARLHPCTGAKPSASWRSS